MTLKRFIARWKLNQRSNRGTDLYRRVYIHPNDDPSKVLFVVSLASMPKDRLARIFNLITDHFRTEKSKIIGTLNTLGVDVGDDNL